MLSVRHQIPDIGICRIARAKIFGCRVDLRIDDIIGDSDIGLGGRDTGEGDVPEFHQWWRQGQPARWSSRILTQAVLTAISANLENKKPLSLLI